MVMTEQPVVETCLFSDILQEVGQGVIDISAFAQFVHYVVWSAMGNDTATSSYSWVQVLKTVRVYFLMDSMCLSSEFQDFDGESKS